MSEGDLEQTARRSDGSAIRRMLARRLIASVLVVVVVTFVVFAFMHAAPGGPEQAIGGPYASAEQRAQIRARYHLDDPMLTQYVQFLSSVTRLDFGNSLTTREPVMTSLSRAASLSVPLLLAAWVAACTIGCALGIATAHRPGGRADRTVLALTVVGASAPAFASGTLLAYVFGVRLGWFPTLGRGAGGLDSARHLVLPVVTLTIFALAATTRVTRVRVGAVLAEDQVAFARGRGLSPRHILRHSVMRNASIQLITQCGAVLIGMTGALIVIERVFSLDGVGTLLVRAISARDIPLIQGITFFLAIFIVGVNLLVDLACMMIDPRIRRGAGGHR